MLVRRLDLQDMRELYAVRAALEGLAAGRPAGGWPRPIWRRWGGWSSRCGCWSTTRPSWPASAASSTPCIAAIAGNWRCEQLLRQLDGHMRRYRTLSSRREPRRRAALEDHRALFEALRARDPETAEQTVRAHIMAACREGEAAAAGLLAEHAWRCRRADR